MNHLDKDEYLEIEDKKKIRNSVLFLFSPGITYRAKQLQVFVE
jgi:hypothetical protein